MNVSQKLLACFKRAVVGVLFLIPCSCAQAEFSIPSMPPYTLPTYFDVKWDISKKDNQIEQEFSVTSYNAYVLSIIFSPKHPPVADEEVRQLREFLGGERYRPYNLKTHEYMLTNTDEAARQVLHLADTGEVIWKYDIPGVIIPVHFKIEKLDNGKITNIITEKDVDTGGQDENCTRRIAAVKLHPGNYKITISTNKGVTLLPDLETFLMASSIPNTRPLKDNE